VTCLIFRLLGKTDESRCIILPYAKSIVPQETTQTQHLMKRTVLVLLELVVMALASRGMFAISIVAEKDDVTSQRERANALMGTLAVRVKLVVYVDASPCKHQICQEKGK